MKTRARRGGSGWTVGCLLAMLGGCGTSSSPPGGGTIDAGNIGAVSGHVHVAGGTEAIGGGTVRLAGRTVTANEQGWFSFDAIAPTDRALLLADVPGYAHAAVPVSVRVNTVSSVDVAMVRTTTTATIDTTAGGTVSGGGASVRFPANALVTLDGRAVTGSASATFTYLDASRPEMLAAFPGGFSGLRTDGSSVTFESFGAVSLELRQGSDLLDLAPGVQATLTIPVATSQASRAPSTSPLWSLDGTTGRWTEEGTATRGISGGNDVYVATIPHLSWWNVDYPLQTTCVRGCVRDDAGNPVINVQVVADGVDYSGSSRAWTGADGCFALDVKLGAQIRVSALQGGTSSVPVVRSTPTTVMTAAANPGACGDIGTLTMAQTLVQVVLTWGERPRDLDSHMTGPSGSGGRFHVYYGSRGDLGQGPYCFLDTDDTSSYGPEVVSISRLVAGRYRYSVHNYSGQANGTIESSHASITLIVARPAAIRRFDVPTANAGSRDVWRVFDLVVDAAGQVTVAPIDAFASASQGYDP